jgi:hypothetical protein
MRISIEQRHREDHLPCFPARTNQELFLPSKVYATLQCDEGNAMPKTAGAITWRRADARQIYEQHEGDTHEAVELNRQVEQDVVQRFHFHSSA